MTLTGKPLPPKRHYLLHYARMLADSGPFSAFSSMRGEAKHRDIKNYANVITSRRCLIMSAAIKHQLGVCYRFVTRSPLLDEMVCGPIELCNIEDHVFYHRFKKTLPSDFDIFSDIERVNWVNVCGTRYEPSMVLITGVDEYCYPKFGKILDIFIFNNQPLFMCQMFENIGFNDHVGGYEVSSSKSCICILHKNLFDYCPLYNFVMSNEEQYVVLKYYL